ncbi:hypothetical protein QCA50_012356 [Cerrena zonata]|uniref:Alpha-galactosidase n=1 Tax=Cerrena zonata TaxID=2478898 RepID=A0AAW0FZ94_9APHY
MHPLNFNPAFTSLLGLVYLLPYTVALDNGIGRTPSMGWNPYNVFLCDTNEAQYHTAAQNLVNNGLNSLGYQYFMLDCGWQGLQRNATGGFTWDTTRLPSGVPALASFVHGLGLKFGVYSDAGYFSCDFVGGSAHWLGSLGNETIDAATFGEWGMDYLKYDNCYAVSPTDFVNYNPPIQLQPHYEAMRDALARINRPVVYSICNWGVQDTARWAGPIGNSWRISNDIGPPNNWNNIIRIINQVVPITQFAKPGAFNDLDMLEVGNSGMTVAEQETHFAFWAAAKSPLLISTDLTNPAQATLDILKNTRLIAVNQDRLGASIAFKRRYTNDHDVWAGPLADGSTVAVIINWVNSSRSLTVDLGDIGITSGIATDLWTGSSLGTLRNTYTATVPAHGSLVLKLTNTTPFRLPSFTYYPTSSPSTSLSGGAAFRTVNSTISVAGNVGNGGSVTLTGLDGGSGGTKLVSIDYINADFTMTNTACSNCRNAIVSVNGGVGQTVQMPLSGQSWDIVYSGYLVSLSGFVSGKNNTITFSNPNAWTPDFYRVGVAN